MVYGGDANHLKFSDGVLVDTNQKKVVQRLGAGDLTFRCIRNRCITTEHRAVVAIADVTVIGSKLIEISTTDFSVRVLQDLN